MKSAISIVAVAVIFLFSGSLYAEEDMGSMGHEKGATTERDGSMMNQTADTGNDTHVATEEETKALPNVGNKICPVSGNQVDDGKMGEAVKYVYNGKIYNLCCRMCVKDFKRNPGKYSKIAEDEAVNGKEEK